VSFVFTKTCVGHSFVSFAAKGSLACWAFFWSYLFSLSCSVFSGHLVTKSHIWGKSLCEAWECGSLASLLSLSPSLFPPFLFFFCPFFFTIYIVFFWAIIMSGGDGDRHESDTNNSSHSRIMGALSSILST